VPMKRLIIILSVFVILMFTSCSSESLDITSSDVDSAVEFSRPEQEVMFVVIRTNFSSGYYFDGAIIDSYGKYHYLPDNFSFDNENWYQVALDARKPQSAKSIEDTDLNTVYKFISEFDANENYDIKTYYEEQLYDYGFDNLYMIYTDSDNKMNYKELCQHGQWTTCLDNKAVIDFVNWMIDNNYLFIDFKYY